MAEALDRADPAPPDTFCGILFRIMNLKDVQTHLDEERGHLESVVAELVTLLGKENSTAVLASSKLPTHEHYRIFRSYIEHEDNLINNRVTWNLAVQGFLFATYGFSLQNLAEVEANPNFAAQIKLSHSVMQLKILVLAIPLVGFALSLGVFFAVRAAQIALKKLREDCKTEVLDKAHEASCYLPLPGGAGKPWAIRLGFVPPFAIPLVFALAWAILFVLLF